MAVQACPGCGSALAPGRPEGLFGCAGCGGSYLDRMALEAAGLAIPAELARRTPRRPRACAGCQKPMSHLVVRGVTLDRCDPCDSLYFDAGELEQVRGGEDDGDTLECDGCGRRAPIASLASRDGKALCPGCLEGDRPNRGATLSAKDFGRAQQHATQARLDDERATEFYAGQDCDLDGYHHHHGPGLLDALLLLFR